MSTQPPRPTAKAAAKSRAARRRRNRDRIRVFFALFFVGIFILGTATTAFIFTNQTAVAPSDTPTPVAALVSPTSGLPSGFDSILKAGDDAAAKGDIAGALSAYQAASSLNQGDAELHYKIGSLLIQQSKYPEAADQLARAVQLDPSGASGTKAKTLMDQNKDKLPTRVISTAGVPQVVGNTMTPAAATTPSSASTSTPTK